MPNINFRKLLAYANYQFYFYGLNILRKSKIKSLSNESPVFNPILENSQMLFNILNL